MSILSVNFRLRLLLTSSLLVLLSKCVMPNISYFHVTYPFIVICYIHDKSPVRATALPATVTRIWKQKEMRNVALCYTYFRCVNSEDFMCKCYGQIIVNYWIYLGISKCYKSVITCHPYFLSFPYFPLPLTTFDKQFTVPLLWVVLIPVETVFGFFFNFQYRVKWIFNCFLKFPSPFVWNKNQWPYSPISLSAIYLFNNKNFP